MEDEITIDLRQYVDVLVRRWRVIVSLTLVTSIVAVLFVLAFPPGYQAVAGVVIVKTKTDIEFDPRFKTVSEEEMGSAGYALAAGADARRRALVGLVRNGTIASRVIAELGDQLEMDEPSPARLLRKVEAELVEKGDLIQIKVGDADPEIAALIANAWGREYEDYVNGIYGGGVSTEYASSVQTELDRVQGQYKQAQEDLEVFVAQSRIDELTRLIKEKKDIIDSLQAGKQTALTSVIDEDMKARKQIIAAYLDAQAQHRLLAFNKEQESKRELVGKLMEAEANARLMAFQKDREARLKLFEQYVDAEINSRLSAFNKDREARAQLFAQYVEAELNNRLSALASEQQAKRDLFKAYAEADSKAKLATFNEQVEARLKTLARYYETRLKLERLLEDARALQAQVRRGGDASAATNHLAIVLLKAEAFASSAGLPGELQLQLDGVSGLEVSAAGQAADLGALIEALETRLAGLETAIAGLSKEIVDNQGYSLLAAERPGDDPLYAAMQEKYGELFEMDDLARAADSASEDSALSQAILDKYDELFGVGALAQSADSAWKDSDLAQAVQARYVELFGVGDLAESAGAAWQQSELDEAILARYDELFGMGALGEASSVISPTAPLFAAIKAQYPELFSLGDLSLLTENQSPDNPLAVAADQRSRELLQMKIMEALPDYAAASEPLAQAIDNLQKEINAMQAKLEQQEATRKELLQARNLAWETYSTLASKQSEVSIATAVTGSEVRFAAPAVPPVGRASSRKLTVLVAAALGAFLGIFAAFAIEYLLGGWVPRSLWGDYEAVWNRAFRWLMAEGPGLPYRAALEASESK